jgi:mutator protein MutT
MTARRPRLIVTAAVIEVNGRFFVTRRPPGVHLEGAWEFPGGKCEPGESHPACLAREIREELDCDVVVGRKIFSTSHSYAARDVELHFFRCELNGAPRPLLGQQMRWVPREELDALDFPPADAEVIEVLKKP